MVLVLRCLVPVFPLFAGCFRRRRGAIKTRSARRSKSAAATIESGGGGGQAPIAGRRDVTYPRRNFSRFRNRGAGLEVSSLRVSVPDERMPGLRGWLTRSAATTTGEIHAELTLHPTRPAFWCRVAHRAGRQVGSSVGRRD